MATREQVRAQLMAVGLTTISDSFLDAWEENEEKFGTFNLDHHSYKSPAFQSLTGFANLSKEDLQPAKQWATQVLEEIEVQILFPVIPWTEVALKMMAVAQNLAGWHTGSPLVVRAREPREDMTAVKLWLRHAEHFYGRMKRAEKVTRQDRFWWATVKPFVLKFEDISG